MCCTLTSAAFKLTLGSWLPSGSMQRKRLTSLMTFRSDAQQTLDSTLIALAATSTYLLISSRQLTLIFPLYSHDYHHNDNT